MLNFHSTMNAKKCVVAKKLNDQDLIAFLNVFKEFYSKSKENILIKVFNQTSHCH